MKFGIINENFDNENNEWKVVKEHFTTHPNNYWYGVLTNKLNDQTPRAVYLAKQMLGYLIETIQKNRLPSATDLKYEIYLKLIKRFSYLIALLDKGSTFEEAFAPYRLKDFKEGVEQIYDDLNAFKKRESEINYNRRFQTFADAMTYKIKEKLEKINQPVTISDLVLKQSGKGYGEFDFRKKMYWQFSPLRRMTDFVDMLATLADAHHRQQHINANGEVISGHENHVTRILLHEFSLYTRKPLSPLLFEKFLANIEAMAKGKSDGVHILISSVPVFYQAQDNANCLKQDAEDYQEKFIANNVIYVECGSYPKLHVTTKINPFFVSLNNETYQDPTYNLTENLYYSAHKKDVFTTLPSAGKTGANYNPLVKCKTAGGAEFYVIIDICLDIKFFEGRVFLDNSLTHTLVSNNDELLPQRVSHLLTSNSFSSGFNCKFLGTLVVADLIEDYNPKLTYIKLPDNITSSLSPFQVKYEKMIINKDEDVCLEFYNLPFGPDASLFFYEPHKIGSLQGKLKKKAERHNENYITRHQSSLFYSPIRQAMPTSASNNLQLIPWSPPLQNGP